MYNSSRSLYSCVTDVLGMDVEVQYKYYPATPDTRECPGDPAELEIRAVLSLVQAQHIDYGEDIYYRLAESQIETLLDWIYANDNPEEKVRGED
jgi:hypothetical protein